MLEHDGMNLRIEAGARRPAFTLRSWDPGRSRLPVRVGTVLAGPPRILCIGPSTWLSLGNSSPGDESLVSVDLSDGLVTIEVSGRASADLMSTACALDFDPRKFPVDTCARTRIAGLPVIIDRRAEHAFELYVSTSYSAFLLAVLRDGAVGLREPIK